MATAATQALPLSPPLPLPMLSGRQASDGAVSPCSQPPAAPIAGADPTAPFPYAPRDGHGMAAAPSPADAMQGGLPGSPSDSFAVQLNLRKVVIMRSVSRGGGGRGALSPRRPSNPGLVDNVGRPPLPPAAADAAAGIDRMDKADRAVVGSNPGSPSSAPSLWGTAIWDGASPWVLSAATPGSGLWAGSTAVAAHGTTQVGHTTSRLSRGVSARDLSERPPSSLRTSGGYLRGANRPSTSMSMRSEESSSSSDTSSTGSALRSHATHDMSVGAIAHSIGNPRASTESPAVTGPDGLVFPSLAIANANAAASPTLQSPLQGAWGAPGPPGVRRRVSVEGSSRPRGLEAGPALVEGASWWGGRALRAEGPAVGYPSPRSAGLRGFDPRALFWPGLSPSSEAPDGAGGMGRGDSGLFGRAEGNSVDMERGPEGAAAGPTEGPGEAGGPEALPLWRRSSLYEAERGPGVKRG